MRASRLARLHEAVDRQAGESVIVIPQQGGGYVPASPDPQRDHAEIMAYVARIPAAVRAPSTGQVQTRTSADTIKFTTSALPYELAIDDLVVVASQRYRVTRIAPFGSDRTVAFVVPVVK